MPSSMGEAARRSCQCAPGRRLVTLNVRVDKRTVTREITVGGGHASGKLGWIHVGLGDADRADVRVQWPDGDTGPWMTLKADQFATIKRDAATPIRWRPTHG